MTPEQLRDWRQSAGLSQSGLAALLGVDPQTISRWERNEREIPAYLHLTLRGLELPKKRPVRSPSRHDR